MFNTSRRGFLQLSASSAAALTVGASLAGLQQGACRRRLQAAARRRY